MEIHPKKMEALVEALHTGLSQVRVLAHRIVLRSSLGGLEAAEQVMRGHGDNQRVLAEAVDGDFPITEIIVGYLGVMLSVNEWDEAFESRSLESVPGMLPLDKMAVSIADFVSRMPMPYKVLFALPDAFQKGLPLSAVVPINAEMRFRRIAEEEVSNYPASTGHDLTDAYVFSGEKSQNRTPPVGIFLEVDESGFFSRETQTVPRLRALERLHTIAGLAMALDLVVRSKAPFIQGQNGYRVYLQQPDETLHLIDYAKLSPASAELLSDLKEPRNYFNFDPEINAKHRMEFYLPHVAAVMGHPKDGRRIENAAKWYFDAHASSDPLLSFIQMMVVLEILYGDKELSDKIGLGELLRNRCAYAIGRGADDRESIIREFKQIYDIRSQIVHRGKNRLSAKERALFQTLSSFCKRAISHEASLLLKDVQAAELEARWAAEAQKSQQGQLF